MSHKNLRFGMLAVQMGFVTAEDVVEALETQVKDYFTTGKHRLIGEILLKKGCLNQGQLDEIIKNL